MMNQERYHIQSRSIHSLCQNQSLRVAANAVLTIWNSRMATFIAMTLRTLRLRVDELPSIVFVQLQLYLHSNEIDTVSWNWTLFNVHSWALAHGCISGSRSRQTMKYDIISSSSFFHSSIFPLFVSIWIYRVPQALVRTQMASFYMFAVLWAGARDPYGCEHNELVRPSIFKWVTIAIALCHTWINSILFTSTSSPFYLIAFCFVLRALPGECLFDRKMDCQLPYNESVLNRNRNTSID